MATSVSSMTRACSGNINSGLFLCRAHGADSFATYVLGKPDAVNPPVRFDEGRELADSPRSVPAYSTPVGSAPKPLTGGRGERREMITTLRTQRPPVKSDRLGPPIGPTNGRLNLAPFSCGPGRRPDGAGVPGVLATCERVGDWHGRLRQGAWLVALGLAIGLGGYFDRLRGAADGPRHSRARSARRVPQSRPTRHESGSNCGATRGVILRNSGGPGN